MYHYLFRLYQMESHDLIREKLERLELKDFYSLEEGGDVLIGAFSEEKISLDLLPEEIMLVKEEDASIDWKRQWDDFTPEMQEGLLKINLNNYREESAPIFLKSGSGFGNMSHPTTRLMLNLMSQEPLHKYQVVDIGCGSGILSLAAWMWNGNGVIGVDIDKEAVKHAKENNLLNEASVEFKENIEESDLTGKPVLVLMNMIRSEQKVAWEHNHLIHDKTSEVLTSGILLEDESVYLKMTSSWGWKMKRSMEEDNWMAFVFET